MEEIERKGQSAPGAESRETATDDVPSVAAIFLSFARIGAFLIGGGYAMLPLLEDEIVRRRKWSTSGEMTDFFALAQVLPGVIAVNTAMLIGNRLRGLAGNVSAACGVIAVPFVLIVLYAVLYTQARDYPLLMRILEGVRPAVAGMMLGMGVRMVWKASRTGWGYGVSLLSCTAVVLWNPPMAGLIAAAVAVGLMLHLFRLRGALGAGRGRC